ncbi:MAG: DUF4240 domain-containing protein [Cytophagales bacterium]|nr:DUF4240 domain-containing protein [Cytophagales bacterium]
MNELNFWKLIESAWASMPLLDELRREALKTNKADLFEGLSFGLDDEVSEAIAERLRELGKDDLVKFNHLMEEKLFRLDREEIHQHTDGSDDGFLYCRGFIVGMGERYYNLVLTNPAKATTDAEAESIPFLGYQVYEDQFGEAFPRESVYPIASGSNPDGWRD